MSLKIALEPRDTAICNNQSSCIWNKALMVEIDLRTWLTFAHDIRILLLGLGFHGESQGLIKQNQTNPPSPTDSSCNTSNVLWPITFCKDKYSFFLSICTFTKCYNPKESKSSFPYKCKSLTNHSCISNWHMGSNPIGFTQSDGVGFWNKTKVTENCRNCKRVAVHGWHRIELRRRASIKKHIAERISPKIWHFCSSNYQK